MTSTRPNRHVDEVIAALPGSAEREQFTRARSVLKDHLIHTREILNGQDFLFAGPHESLHTALKELRTLEHRYSRFLLFDYARIDEYFLLRVVGQEQHYEVIREYFG